MKSEGFPTCILGVYTVYACIPFLNQVMRGGARGILEKKKVVLIFFRFFILLSLTLYNISISIHSIHGIHDVSEKRENDEIT